MKENPKYELTKEEQHILEQKIKEGLAEFRRPKPTLSPEKRFWIHQAANSNSEELQYLACAYTFAVVEDYYKDYARQHIEDNKILLEDAMTDVYLLILENISHYDGVQSLFDFLDPFVTVHFMLMRIFGSDRIRTKYYQDAGVSVIRAIREMEKMGYKDPTALEIHVYMKRHYDQEITVDTINRAREYN